MTQQLRKLCIHSRQVGMDARFERDVEETGDLRGQDHGHCIVEHTLSKEQSVQIHVYLQLVEDGQDRHCEQRQTRRNSSDIPSHDRDH